MSDRPTVGATGTAPGVSLATARDDGLHLTLAGELDSLGAARLRALLDDQIAPAARLSLDLSRVTHLSSEALAVLVHAYRRLRDSGGSLRLTGVSVPVVRVLRISGLHRVLLIEPPAAPAEPARQAAGSQAGS